MLITATAGIQGRHYGRQPQGRALFYGGRGKAAPSDKSVSSDDFLSLFGFCPESDAPRIMFAGLGDNRDA